MLRAAHQTPSRQPRRHLARKQRHRGRDVGCTRIEPRQDEGGQGDERSASGKRVLRARPKPGDKEQEKQRRTMRDVLTGEKKARSSALSVQASPPSVVNHAPVVSEPKKRASPEGGPSLGGNAQGELQHRYATRDAALHNMIVSYLDRYEAGCRRTTPSTTGQGRPPAMKRPGAGPGLCLAQCAPELGDAADLLRILVRLGLDGPGSFIGSAQ